VYGTLRRQKVELKDMPGRTFTLNLSLLLVEDNADHAALIQRLGNNAAGNMLRFKHVGQLAAALEVLGQTTRVDAVLLDLSLPDSDLLQTLPAVLAARPDIPIVVLTSLADLEFAATAVKQGAQDYLVKSELSGDLLLRSIHHAIERKKITLELQRSNEELRRFAHTLAHEIRAPLQLLASASELIRVKHAASFDEQSNGFIDSMQAAVNGMSELIRDLLDFAQVGTGSEKSFARVELQTALDAALLLLRHDLDALAATVTHDKLPAISGDEVQLRHLLQNLIGNSLKYGSERAPQIHISAEAAVDNYWTIRVEDNGRGIESEFHEQIFEPLKRFHEPDKIPGSGIGLAFCKRVVEHHGGRLWVRSEPGEGSTFFFTLPAAPEVARYSDASVEPSVSL
jgi:signal transduction histidine kinase